MSDNTPSQPKPEPEVPPAGQPMPQANHDSVAPEASNPDPSAPDPTTPITPPTRYHMVLPVKRPVSASDNCSTGAFDARQAKNSSRPPTARATKAIIFDCVMIWSFGMNSKSARAVQR